MSPYKIDIYVHVKIKIGAFTEKQKLTDTGRGRWRRRHPRCPPNLCHMYMLHTYIYMYNIYAHSCAHVLIIYT